MAPFRCRAENRRRATRIARELQTSRPTRADLAFYRTVSVVLRRRRRLPVLIALCVGVDDPRRRRLPRLSLSGLRDRLARAEGEDQPPLSPGIVSLARIEAEARLAHEDARFEIGILFQPAVGISEGDRRFGPLPTDEIHALDGVVVDVDLWVPEGEEIADYSATSPRRLIRALVAAGLPEPTVIVATGGGYHLAWLFTRRVPSMGRPGARVHPIDRIAAFQRLVVEVLRPFGADPNGSGPGRAMRFPGSYNPERRCWVHVVHNGPPVDPRLIETSACAICAARGDNGPLRSVWRRPARRDGTPIRCSTCCAAAGSAGGRATPPCCSPPPPPSSPAPPRGSGRRSCAMSPSTAAKTVHRSGRRC